MAAPAAVTLGTIGVIGGASSGASSLINLLVQQGMDNQDAENTNALLERVIPIIQAWEEQYMEILEAFAEEHPSADQHAVGHHFGEFFWYTAHTHAGVLEIIDLIKDIGSNVTEVASRRLGSGLASPLARGFGIAAGAASIVSSLHSTVKSAIASNAGMSEIADLIDCAADRLAVCLHLFRPFMRWAELDSVIKFPHLMKLEIGPSLAFSRPLVDRLFSGGDEQVEAHFKFSLQDGRSYSTGKFSARFHAADADNMAVVCGTKAVLFRVKDLDVSQLAYKIRGLARRESLFRMTFGDSSLTEECQFSGLGQHEHSSFQCRMSMLPGVQ